MNKMKKNVVSYLLCMVLVVAMALSMTACGETAPAGGEDAEITEGQAAYTFVVVDAEGNEETMNLTSDKATVGEALLAEGLIEGEESEYGLYVKTVNGITADYDADQSYWAFYVNGEYAETGVDTTELVDGSTYMFKIEK